jgi:hypothetical protein
VVRGGPVGSLRLFGRPEPTVGGWLTPWVLPRGGRRIRSRASPTVSPGVRRGPSPTVGPGLPRRRSRVARGWFSHRASPGVRSGCAFGARRARGPAPGLGGRGPGPCGSAVGGCGEGVRAGRRWWDDVRGSPGRRRRLRAGAAGPCRHIPVWPATPCTRPQALGFARTARDPLRRTRHRPKYIRYEGPCPAHREHAPDAAGPVLQADDGNVTTRPGAGERGVRARGPRVHRRGSRASLVARSEVPGGRPSAGGRRPARRASPVASRGCLCRPLPVANRRLPCRLPRGRLSRCAPPPCEPPL